MMWCLPNNITSPGVDLLVIPFARKPESAHACRSLIPLCCKNLKPALGSSYVDFLMPSCCSGHSSVSSDSILCRPSQACCPAIHSAAGAASSSSLPWCSTSCPFSLNKFRASCLLLCQTPQTCHGMYVLRLWTPALRTTILQTQCCPAALACHPAHVCVSVPGYSISLGCCAGHSRREMMCLCGAALHLSMPHFLPTFAFDKRPWIHPNWSCSPACSSCTLSMAASEMGVTCLALHCGPRTHSSRSLGVLKDLCRCKNHWFATALQCPPGSILSA